WPRVAAAVSDVDIAGASERIRGALAASTGSVEAGATLYGARCGACHTLFGRGGTLGPDLTGYERQNVDFWIPAIVAPGLEIREGYEHFIATLEDGRVV